MTKVCIDRQIKRVDLLLDAIKIFSEEGSTADQERAVQLLTQMQQIAIVIGEILEQDQGDVQQLVRTLEDICELLYQLSLALADQQQVRTYETEVEECLMSLREQLAVMTPRKEIVFLPYQVSMWDSLESVWQAADSDKEVDSYVVPIPFFDVTPDGSMGALHYHGGDYPPEVLVTSYEHYYPEERHPDVILFHNPYDGCNAVTRVPEQYYAVNLKKCTEKLVYIPYFVTAPGGPGDHQCYMPGVLFADHVIAQPGAICEKYSRIYSEKMKENGWEGLLAPAEGKFIGMESPKFDKVINSRYTVEDLPADWQQVIRRPEGSRKRIILYNLTIDVLLRFDEKLLNKIDRVFAVFREKKNDVVLWWRPHPLLMNTIDSMRPELRDAYLSRVCAFRQEGWGIFDDTPDPNLAMVISDGYYGDWSSVLVTYKVTEKPILIQNVEGEDTLDAFLDQVLDSPKQVSDCQSHYGADIYAKIKELAHL